MIIEFIFTSLINLFESIFDGVNINSIDSTTIDDAKESLRFMILNAENLIDLVIPYNIAKLLLVVVLSIEAFVGIYSLVMWVLRKIPVASIE